MKLKLIKFTQVAICLFFLLSFPGCKTSHRDISAQSGTIEFTGGNGTSFEDAVVILGASGSWEGIAAERAWFTKTYPGFQKTGQALLNQDGKVYDLITLVSPSGEKREIYFDITDFFGKEF